MKDHLDRPEPTVQTDQTSQSTRIVADLLIDSTTEITEASGAGSFLVGVRQRLKRIEENRAALGKWAGRLEQIVKRRRTEGHGGRVRKLAPATVGGSNPPFGTSIS